MQIPTSKSDINSILTENYVEVIFTKVNGTPRTMLATLKPEVVAHVAQKNGHFTGSIRQVPEHQVCCIDAQIGEWRSFRIDSITSFNIVQIKQ